MKTFLSLKKRFGNYSAARLEENGEGNGEENEIEGNEVVKGNEVEENEADSKENGLDSNGDREGPFPNTNP